ncbi:MAG TPA: HAD-IIA family hydrolase [Acidimicrobiales bacterium]
MTTAISWLCDMDGVLIANGHMVEGADRFLDHLRATNRSFLVLTNNSLFSPKELSAKLSSMGLEVAQEQMWTSALATAQFVNDQRPKGTAFVIGENSLHEALENIGYHEGTANADYVVLGETWSYSYDDITTAIRLIEKGCSFVATNPETTGPTPDGSHPGCGAVAALIESTTGVEPYFVGKPNPVMIRDALNIMGAHSKSTVMIGDRMETDILAGTGAGVETILVLSGFAKRDDVNKFAYQPSQIVDSVADLIDER